MSSYLVVNINGADITCASRSTKLYSYCDAPYDDDEEVTISKLDFALKEAEEDRIRITQDIDDYQWTSDRVSDYEELWALKGSINQLNKDLVECSEAILLLRYFKEIIELNSDNQSFKMTWGKG